MRSEREGSVVLDQPKQGGDGKFSTQGREKGGTLGSGACGSWRGVWRLWVSGLRALVCTTSMHGYFTLDTVY